MNWYNFDEKSESKREYLERIRYDKVVSARVDSLSDLISDKIEQGVQYRIVTENSVNAIVMIDYLLRLVEVVEIYIAIYRMNLQSVRRIKEISQNTPINLILSSFFRENKKYEAWTREIEEFSKNNSNIRLSFASNHAKIFLAKTKNNDYIVLEGSGNLSDNARIEQYLIENSKQMYDFHSNWMEKILQNGQ